MLGSKAIVDPTTSDKEKPTLINKMYINCNSSSIGHLPKSSRNNNTLYVAAPKNGYQNKR